MSLVTYIPCYYFSVFIILELEWSFNLVSLGRLNSVRWADVAITVCFRFAELSGGGSRVVRQNPGFGHGT